MSDFIFTAVCPIVGVFLCNFSLSASVLEMRLARRQGDLGSIYPVGLAMGLVGSISWCLYGTMIGDIYVLASATIGALVGVFSVTTAFDLIGASQSLGLHQLGGQMEAILYTTMIVWLTIGYGVAVSPNSATAEFGAGLWCAIVTCLFNMSPLFRLFDILRAKDASSINLLNNSINLVNSFVWISYGLFAINNIFVYLPSMVALLFSVLAIVIKLNLPSASDKKTGPNDNAIDPNGMSMNDSEAQNKDDKENKTVEGTEQTGPSEIVDLVIDRSTYIFEMVRQRAETTIQFLEDTVWNIPVFEAFLPAELRDQRDKEKELLVAAELAAELAAEKGDTENSSNPSEPYLDPVREVYDRRFTVTDPEDSFGRSRARSRSRSSSYASDANQYVIGRRRGSSATEFQALPGVTEELKNQVDEEEDYDKSTKALQPIREEEYV